MLDTLLAILKESGAAAWEVWDVETRGWEFYFIRHALDQNRAKSVEHLTVKVYQSVEDGAYLGSASCEIAPTASEAQMRAQIEALCYRATLVKNKPYTLRGPEAVELPALEEVDLAAISAEFLRAVRTLPETEGEDVNSYELFVSEKTRRFLNSEGIDVTERCPESMLEIVVNARREGHEIELYRNYTAGGCDAAALHRLVDANFDLRATIFDITPENKAMVAAARAAGASAKFAGSGGAIVGTYGDDDQFERLRRNLAAIGCKTIKPRIAF